MNEITHHLIDKEVNFSSFLHENQISREKSSHLLYLGAIYLNHSRLKNMHDSFVLKSGDYLRIHHNPRRFQLVDSIAVHFENDDFLIINKPSGLPVHKTLDNQIENVMSLLEKQIGQAVSSPHRLDINTSGLMIFCKNKTFLKKMNVLFEKGQVHKIYHAKSSSSRQMNSTEEKQLWTHYMRPSSRCPKKLSLTAQDEWKKCQLRIHELESLDRQRSFQIELITGRTHQIRCQMSFEGLAIDGDQLYGSRLDQNGKPSDSLVGSQNQLPIALQCTQLSFLDFKFDLEVA